MYEEWKLHTGLMCLQGKPGEDGANGTDGMPGLMGRPGKTVRFLLTCYVHVFIVSPAMNECVYCLGE